MQATASIEENPQDPAPRSYPKMVELLRRGRWTSSEIGPLSAAEVEAWLLDAAMDEDDFLLLYQGFLWRLVAAGIPIVRASLHVGTLHPQLYGYAWNWNSDDGLCDEVKVDESVLSTDAYRKNPLFRVVEGGEHIRVMTETLDGTESGLLKELKEIGITEYMALPLKAHGKFHNAATLATRADGGFTAGQFDQIERLLHVFALHVDRHIAANIAENIVTTYLGAEAGGQVLSGSIKRGAGKAIDAVIWASDLRGFTELADTLDERALTEVLNAYFEQVAGAVIDHGGEVLKFIGDGLLAVFPFDAFATHQHAADAAVQAAEAALATLERLNTDAEALPDVAGWRPLRTGIALHRGEVFFGNVGAPARLDFTVIGMAVNAASRVEGLCKSTGHPLLVTAAVCALSSRDFDSLGEFQLKGLDEPVSVFALRDAPQGG
ncbi:adenylate/guanylate cyclase domain-containing protein [Hoeflea poritis]|uniref:Adenylate/guanylate cyclase domain-containing protein n=1 Tax=Hoeflea poritis TaxID=2993659 RepID=A0ABT4VJ83_9HYPH|nr:adenylate/guanylate cyclase domain-containing protein [Hoeflea poritis]MDA4844787.1 adenylate/guanylate cyclase domain-containing protein [Hoeflea poritis]